MNAMWKKLLSLLLVLTMLVGLMPAVFASEEAAAEPAEQAEEMLPEENGGAEDPADADEPGIGEEPGDPDTPAVTPEEPDTPGDPDTPEDPEPGEEPVTPEEPAEEPDAEEVPEDEDDEFDMDIEIQSEGLGDRKLTPTDDLRFLQYHRYGLGPEMFDGGSIFVQIEWTGTDPKLAYAIAAESTTMRYYIDYHPKKDLIANTPLKPGEEFGRYYINLPAGEYSVRVIAWDPNAATPTYYASGEEKTLIVLPAPEVQAVTPASEENDGCIILKDPYNTDILDLVVNGTPGYDKHTTVLPDLAYGDYVLCYRCFDTVPNQPGNPNAVVIDSAYTYVSVPVQAGASFFSPYIELDGDYWYPGDSPVPLYKGDEVRISTYVSGEDNRLSFKSDNTKVATVDAVGNVKAVGVGTANITVKSEANPDLPAAILTVTVTEANIKSLKFEKTTLKTEWNPVIAKYGYPIENPFVTLLKSGDNVTAALGITGAGLCFEDVYDGDTFYTTSVKRNLTGSSLDEDLYPSMGGVYTVTAVAGSKTASCTVQVDGFSNCIPDGYGKPTAEPSAESVFYSGGKVVKGWIAWDTAEKCYLLGKAALAGGLTKLNNRKIYYADASGRLLSQGFHKIDGKLYLFGSDDSSFELFTASGEGLMPTGWGDQIYQDAAGHLRTGWQKRTNGNPVYLDPDYGYLVTCSWVPYGKGMTWVDCDGDNMDADYKVLQNEKGLHVHLIDLDDDSESNDGVPYCFQDGIRYTGWVFAEYDGGGEVYKTKATKASLFKLYFDPNNSGQLVHFDPNNEGKVKVELAKPFWVDGKEYRYAKADSMMGVLLPAACDQSAKTNLLVSQDGSWWASAPDGSVIKSAMVDAYDLRGGNTYTVYAFSDGSLAWEEWVAVGGKSYYFGSDRTLQATEITDTGLRVKINSGYFTEDSSYSAADVVAKPVKEGKPKEGYCYYYNGEKLTNCILYEKDYASLWVPVLALDKNGKPHKGPAVVTARPYLDAPMTESYVVNKGGFIKHGRVEHYETNSVSFNEVKGKLYASYSDGTVLKDGIYNYYYKWNVSGTFWPDKNGVLRRNTFKTIDVGKIYFGANGIIADGSPLTVKGKTYLLESKQSAELGEWVKVVKTSDPNYVLNKDGSVKLGWVTYPDKTKRYSTIDQSGNPYAYDYLHEFEESLNMPSRIWKIDGKLYCLDRDGVVKTGWLICGGRVRIWDMASFIETDGYEGRICDINGVMYFDPKTGAAVTGSWKTVPKLLWSEAQEKAFDQYENIIPMDNSEKTAKYWFKEDGTLAVDEDLEIGGRLYHFNVDGTGAGIAGWVDADKTQYRLKNGQLAGGRTKIDSLWYYFDTATGRKVTRQLRKTGGKWYYYNDQGVQDTVDVYYDWVEGRYTFGSTTGKDLRFVWNKDGSLAKVVYAAGGQPAAGESVSFGYAVEALVDGTGCGFVLDSKGLPLTGVVAGFNPGEGASSYIHGYFDTCSIVVNADGSRLVCRDDKATLVKIGKDYYMMNGPIVGAWGEAYVDSYGRGELDCSLLPAADQAQLEQWFACLGGGVPLGIDADGRLPQNTALQITAGPLQGTWHTIRLGICPKYAGLYKSGGKWYLNNNWYPAGVYNAYGYNDYSSVQINIKMKDNGELIGFYDYKTDKALTGTYKLNDFSTLVFLKNGKPQTGKQTNPIDGVTYDLPKELGWIFTS